MATINKRYVKLSIVWDKEDPDNLTWKVDAKGYVTDDSEKLGEKLIRAATEWDTLARGDFSIMSGVDIQVVMNEASTAILQAQGSGQGTHTVNTDLD